MALFPRTARVAAALLSLSFFLKKELAAQSAIAAFHRCGQTFITWAENPMAQQYRIYRHSQPIDAVNLGQAQFLVALGQGSGRHITEEWRNNGFYNTVQTRFVIEDLGPELPIGTGLAVWTTQPGGAGDAFYAITRVQDGQEVLDIQPGVNAISAAIPESTAEPCPVKVWQSADGLSAVFTQFVDIKNWNITYEGFAYNYAVMKPLGYDPAQSYPLCFDLHCWGCRYNPTLAGGAPFGLPVILVYPDDPGKTWWFGFSKSHQYRQQWPDNNWFLPTDPAMSGPVVNFTEQRVLKIMDELEQLGGYNFDKNRVYLWGNSMGGTGALTMASRYPDIVAASYCSLPVTNFEVSHWNYDCAIMWGPTWLDLPVEIGGKHAAHLQKYSGQSVWDWQNTQRQMRDRMADEMALICTAHGDADNYVEWWNQGDPWYQQMQDSMRRGGSGWTQNMGGHDWMGFKGTGLNWGWLPNTGDQWKFKKNESFPAFTRFSGNSWTNHNLNIQWASPANGSFPGAITDAAGEWSVLLKLADHPGFASTFNQPLDSAWADVTPRRLQNFKIETGKNYRWQWLDEATAALLSEGVFAPDQFNLLTVPQVLVKKEARRLRIAPEVSAPPPCESPAALSISIQQDTTAEFSWPPVNGVLGYLVAFVKAGAPDTAFLYGTANSATATGLSPCTDYYVSVRSNCPPGQLSDPPFSVPFTTGGCPPLPCDAPLAPSAALLDDTTAQFSWQPDGGLGWLVFYQKTGAADTTAFYSSSAMPVVGGLAPCTGYRFWVKAICGPGSVSDAAGPVAFTTGGCPPPPCEKVTGIAATDSTATSVALAWAAVPGAVSYNVQYRLLGAPNWFSATVAQPSVNLKNLDSCTTYEARISATCGPMNTGNWSQLFVFKTPDCTVSTTGFDWPGSVSVFPNPSNGFINICIDHLYFSEKTVLSLFDFSGRKLFEESVEFSSINCFEKNLEAVPPGLYQLSLEAADGRVFSKKLAVVR